VAHFGAGCIGSLRDKFKADKLTAVRAFGADSIFIQQLDVLVLHPDQPSAFRTGSSLRHSSIPNVIMIVTETALL
jgi:hypothetical protein